ncbi:MAG: 50S ribosomal protein L14 [Desulfurococcales archaeon]|nr:50S ribosomal protein L14 [Desulfurococcales archaeon]
MAKKTLKSSANNPRRRYSPGLPIGARVNVADNSGARVAMIIGVPEVKSRLRRIPAASVGDIVMVSIKRGKPELLGQVTPAIIIRQKKPYRRPDGTRVAFEDNAVVIITPEGLPKGTEIRGPVAREAAERWTPIANLATLIV